MGCYPVNQEDVVPREQPVTPTATARLAHVIRYVTSGTADAAWQRSGRPRHPVQRLPPPRLAHAGLHISDSVRLRPDARRIRARRPAHRPRRRRRAQGRRGRPARCRHPRPGPHSPGGGVPDRIPVRHDEPAEHLGLQFATTTTDANFSRLTVTQDARARVLANPARRWTGASLRQGGTLAYITTRPIDDDTNELGVTVHGLLR